MSDLERAPVEGVIVDPGEPPPFSTPDEAREVMDAAWGLLSEGTDKFEQGRQLLAEAQRRQAWKILGFDSWQDCVVAGIGEHLRTTVAPEARIQLAIELRQDKSLSTRDIAAAFQVSHTTIVRDLRVAREDGRLGDEPERIRAHNGGMRNATVPTPRRADLAKPWRNAVDDIVRRTQTLANLMDDDRYGDRRQDLATTTRADLLRAHITLTSVLDDFDRHGEN